MFKKAFQKDNLKFSTVNILISSIINIMFKTPNVSEKKQQKKQKLNVVIV